MLLQQLFTFLRVVEVGSFTRAGELLNLSQPAVTRQIAALEEEFGGPLFERRGKGIHLTPRGKVVLDYAQAQAAEIDSLRSRLAALNNPEQGMVSIASVTTTGLFTLPPLLTMFNQRHPQVRFRLWSGRVGGVIDRVLAGEADLGLVTSPYLHPRLECHPLFEDPVVLVAAPERAAALPSPLPLQRLAQEDLIAYQSPSRFRTLVEAHLEQAGLYPQMAMELDSHEAVKTMVNLGYGIAMVPRTAVAAELTAGTLTELAVPDLPPLSRTTCLLLPKNRGTSTPAVAEFIGLLRSSLTRT